MARGDDTLGMESHMEWIETLADSVTGSIPVERIVESVQASVEHLPFRGDNAGRGGFSTGETGRAGMYRAKGELTEERFEAGAEPELEVREALAGEIAVQAGESSVITVRARKSGALKALSESPFKARQEGNRVVVSPRSMAPVDLEIEVPSACKVTVKTVNADVAVRGTQLSTAVETVDGEVTLEGLRGDCRVRTVSGDASARHLSGALTWTTMSADLEVTDSRLQSFTLQNVSGSCTVETSLAPNGQYLASTTSGDLLLFIPPDTGASVLVKTSSGSVVSDLPTEIIVADRRRWEGRINGGGASVEMTSVSGDLRIEALRVDAAGPAAEPAVPQPGDPSEASETEARVEDGSPHDPEGAGAAPSDETTEILRALERGELDVDGAMSRLDALDRER